MHKLNLEQGAKTQISRAVELLQISADNKAIIPAEMEASSNPVRWQHWQKLQPNVFLHRFAFLSLALKSKTFSYRRSLVRTQECHCEGNLLGMPGTNNRGFLIEERDKDLEQVSEWHHCPFFSFSPPPPPRVPTSSFLALILWKRIWIRDSDTTWAYKHMVWKYIYI